MNTTILPAKPNHPAWQRFVLLSALAYEAIGCLVGAALLIATPDGRSLGMPVASLNGFFPSYLIPGILLLFMSVINALAFISVLRRKPNDWLMAGLAIGGMTIWFWVEIAVFQQLHWAMAIWGLPVLLAGLVVIPLFPRPVLQRSLLMCGIISSVLYVAINIIVPTQWGEYDSVTQTVSELSAVAAPTRMLWVVLCTPYTFLVIAFAVGVRMASGGSRKLRWVGTLLFAYGALGILWPFAPMHLRETLAAGGGTISDTLHLTLGAVTEVIYIVALIIAATLGGRFGIYSIATLLLLVVFGVLTFLESPEVATNGSTPFIGLWERINIAVFLLWMTVFALKLMNRKKGLVLPDPPHQHRQ